MSEQCESIFQEGDTIEWENEYGIHQAEIMKIDDSGYCVWVDYPYLQDIISFDKAKLITKK